MKSRQQRSLFQFSMWEENPRELFQAKPNPHQARKDHQYANLNFYYFIINWFIVKNTLQPKAELHAIYKEEKYNIKTQAV